MYAQPHIPANAMLRCQEEPEFNQQRHPSCSSMSAQSYQDRGNLQIATFSRTPDLENIQQSATQSYSNFVGASGVANPISSNSSHYQPGRQLIQVILEQQDMWRQFHSVGTEMILTKSGRRMFPGCRIRLSGLNPDVKYCVMMSVERVDSNRYRYQNGRWIAAGPGEVEFPRRYFVHPESPATGLKLTKSIISFHKVKLTNSNAASNYVDGKLIMHSMHRYQVCIHVVETDDPSNLNAMQSFPLPITSFITVTAYQNAELTKLKIDNNPFAKGFREDGARGSRIGKNQSRDELTVELYQPTNDLTHNFRRQESRPAYTDHRLSNEQRENRLYFGPSRPTALGHDNPNFGRSGSTGVLYGGENRGSGYFCSSGGDQQRNSISPTDGQNFTYGNIHSHSIATVSAPAPSFSPNYYDANYSQTTQFGNHRTRRENELFWQPAPIPYWRNTNGGAGVLHHRKPFSDEGYSSSASGHPIRRL